MNAIAYIRCSTDRQAESGLGLDAQRSSVEACAARMGVAIVRTFEDAGVSGTLPLEQRPVLLEAIAALKRGSCLLIAKRDRLSRDIIVSAMVERLVTKRGARIVSAAGESSDGDDPASVMMRRMLDVFSSYEAALIASRTRSALAAKRRRGERISRYAPFGQRFAADGRMLEPDVTEQETLRTIRQQREDGRTLRAIAEELNRAGCRTRIGSPWKFQNVQTALRRAAVILVAVALGAAVACGGSPSAPSAPSPAALGTAGNTAAPAVSSDCTGSATEPNTAGLVVARVDADRIRLPFNTLVCP